MKIKHFSKLLAAGFLCVCSAMSLAAGNPDSANIALPKPQMDKGKPLMQVLKERKSTREFSPRKISDQDLSNMLWAGFGINRPETGGRTAPSAMNMQEIDLYVTLEQGCYRYDAKSNALILVVAKDLRPMAGKQAFVKDAPANIIFVADYSRIRKSSSNDSKSYSIADAAFTSENIYLYCASEGLATVVRASIDKPELAKAMKLMQDQEIIFGQTVGYPKK
ncbi:MAG: SagB/ThcOx family dehydrogenase [Chitinivibrionales bacterium]